jgi:hypothetical protein
MSYVLYLEKHFDIETLKEVISTFLNIDVRSIGYLNDTSIEEKEVYIDIENYDIGFGTRLAVYKDLDFCSNLKEIDLSLFLSQKLDNDVLISFWTNNPFLWILVRPDGELFKVEEIPREEGGIEINFESKEIISLSLVRKEKKF